MLALPPAERAALVQAWALFLLVEIGLRVLSFPRLLALLGKTSRGSPDSPGRADGPSLARLAWAVGVAGRYTPVAPTCLKSALVLSWLLRRRGVATTLAIGVARREGGLTAHAWLEREGQAVAGMSGGEGYTPLCCLGTMGREG